MKKQKFTKELTKKISLLVLVAILFPVIFGTNVLAKSVYTKKQVKNVNSNSKYINKEAEIIDKYQEKYFNIIKRNNVLLQYEDSAELNNDRTELENLFTEVEKQITDKKDLKKYKKMQKQFSKCDGITTIDINKCADEYYNAITKLLNNTYKKVGTKINQEDFKNLILSENTWEKEVEDYKKVYDSMEFGTIGTSIYYSYQINMREFRTLLLMMYI